MAIFSAESMCFSLPGPVYLCPVVGGGVSNKIFGARLFQSSDGIQILSIFLESSSYRLVASHEFQSSLFLAEEILHGLIVTKPADPHLYVEVPVGYHGLSFLWVPCAESWR